MTIKEELLKSLESKGMFPTQAQEVFNIYYDGLDDYTKEALSMESKEYPPMLTVVIRLSVDAVAKDWIAEHAPDAWFRELFEQQVV